MTTLVDIQRRRKRLHPRQYAASRSSSSSSRSSRAVFLLRLPRTQPTDNSRLVATRRHRSTVITSRDQSVGRSLLLLLLLRVYVVGKELLLLRCRREYCNARNCLRQRLCDVAVFVSELL